MIITTWMLVSAVILILLTIGFFFIRKNKKQKKLSRLAGIAFAFVIAGICFGDNRLAGYSLMGIGIIIAVTDIFLKNNKK